MKDGWNEDVHGNLHKHIGPWRVICWAGRLGVEVDHEDDAIEIWLEDDGGFTVKGGSVGFSGHTVVAVTITQDLLEAIAEARGMKRGSDEL